MPYNSPKKQREHDQQYYHEHKEEILEKHRLHKDKNKEQRRVYYQNNREKFKQKYDKYYENHRDEANERNLYVGHAIYGYIGEK